MAGTFQVTCHTPDDADRDRRMQGIGGPSGGGWYLSIDQIIHNIENKGEKFWTVAPTGKSVWVYVRTTPNGRKYITTDADGVEPNNLLALPHCL